MKEELYDSEREQIDKFKGFCAKMNAEKEFRQFLNSIENNDGLVNECLKIYRIIDDIILNKEKEQFETNLKVGEQFYRARIINSYDYKKQESGIRITKDGKCVGYNAINSCEPMVGISGEGRNNIIGSSYLYLASNPATACMEIKSQFGDLISLATFEIKEELKIIDFATEKNFSRKDTQIYGMSMGVFFTNLMFRYCEPAKGKNAYKATQLISDYLRKTGVDGISYKSFLCPNGTNYTIFNSHPSKITFKNSKILIHKQANHSFWDFNEQCAILSNECGKMLEYDKEIAEKHMRDFKTCLIIDNELE